MMQNEIRINGVVVELTWGEDEEHWEHWHGDENAIGVAVHAVNSDELAAGVADGPSDGEKFTVEGVRYELGTHEIEEDDDGDGTKVCYADIYEVGDEC